MADQNTTKGSAGAGFWVRDCSLVVRATGVSAVTLRELRDDIREVDDGSVYHHFWGRLLQPLFDEPEYNNDFASWCHRALHDKMLAERLSVVDPTEFDGIDQLREELEDILELHMDDSQLSFYSIADQPFYFLTSQIVVFDTGIELSHPRELLDVLPRLGSGSIFYHFVDARRRRDDAVNDFSGWLDAYGSEFENLRLRLDSIDPYFSSLNHIRDMLQQIFQEQFGEVVA